MMWRTDRPQTELLVSESTKRKIEPDFAKSSLHEIPKARAVHPDFASRDSYSTWFDAIL
jgi:hypothetical protein